MRDARDAQTQAMPLQVRPLAPRDVPSLLELERAKWEPGQAADAPMLRLRIARFPDLCLGAFCPDTGSALASLFLRPVDPAIFTAPTRWEAAAHAGCAAEEATRSLFGISLSSKRADAVQGIFRYFYPRALKAGWRDVYLGSPIPGLRQAREADPSLPVWKYVHARQRCDPRAPRDAQLRYYFRKGFREIVSIQQDYFPHAASLDYGVILRCRIPLSLPHPLWRVTPLRVLEPLSRLVLAAAG